MYFIQTEVEGQKVPTMVRALRHRVIDVSMGKHHTAVILELGTVWAFGRNLEGQLGVGETKPVNAPVEVKSMAKENIVVIDYNSFSMTTRCLEILLFAWDMSYKSNILVLHVICQFSNYSEIGNVHGGLRKEAFVWI